MTIEKLYEAARLRVRKSISDDLDADVRRLADTAIGDLKRIGVDPSWLENPSDPLIVETVLSRRIIPLTRQPIRYYREFTT